MYNFYFLKDSFFLNPDITFSKNVIKTETILLQLVKLPETFSHQGLDLTLVEETCKITQNDA